MEVNQDIFFKKLPKIAMFLESQASSKFSTTWRPSGDYIHLKVTFLVQRNSIQVGGSSYLLWAIENFEEFSDLAAKLSKVEHEEKINDSEKLTFIFKGLKYKFGWSDLGKPIAMF